MGETSISFTPEYCMEKFGKELCTVRKEIHAHPELGMEEFRTTALLKEKLREIDIPIVDLNLKTGVVGVIQGGHSGPTVALRADIDALPVNEETGISYASRTPGLMHACGHDVHTCGLLGAAKLLKERESDLHGTVLLIFQPAEEPITGAVAVIATGLYEKYEVEATFGLHVWPELALGTVGITSGTALAAKDAFQITVRGVGGHGSGPQTTKDPIAAGAEVISALYANLNRNISPFETVAVSICRVSAGNCDNVIPDTFTAEGSMRSFSEETRHMVLTRIEEISKNVAAAYGCTAEFMWLSGVPATENSKELDAVAYESAAETVGRENLEIIPPIMVSEDFALYPQPLYYYRLGVHEEGTPVYALHNAHFLAPDRAICYGAALLANSALYAGKTLQQN